MAQSPAEIAAELKLFGLSSLDDLINEVDDDARAQPGKRRRTPECLLAEHLLDALVEVKAQAERYIAVLAAQEAQAQQIAEEADRQYEETWGGFVSGVTGVA